MFLCSEFRLSPYRLRTRLQSDVILLRLKYVIDSVQATVQDLP